MLVVKSYRARRVQVCSWFFERRLWCRHLCPIGGMNGMFAKLSMTELRARQGVCSGETVGPRCRLPHLCNHTL